MQRPNPRGAPKHAVFVDDTGRRARRSQLAYRAFVLLGLAALALFVVSVLGGVPLPGLSRPVPLPSNEPAHPRGQAAGSSELRRGAAPGTTGGQPGSTGVAAPGVTGTAGVVPTGPTTSAVVAARSSAAPATSTSSSRTTGAAPTRTTGNTPTRTTGATPTQTGIGKPTRTAGATPTTGRHTTPPAAHPHPTNTHAHG